MSFRTKLFGSSQSKILSAVEEGDLERLKALLKRNPDLVFDRDDMVRVEQHRPRQQRVRTECPQLS
jgi:hypothetical protein